MRSVGRPVVEHDEGPGVMSDPPTLMAPELVFTLFGGFLRGSGTLSFLSNLSTSWSTYQGRLSGTFSCFLDLGNSSWRLGRRFLQYSSFLFSRDSPPLLISRASWTNLWNADLWVFMISITKCLLGSSWLLSGWAYSRWAFLWLVSGLPSASCLCSSSLSSTDLLVSPM